MDGTVQNLRISQAANGLQWRITLDLPARLCEKWKMATYSNGVRTDAPQGFRDAAHDKSDAAGLALRIWCQQAETKTLFNALEWLHPDYHRRNVVLEEIAHKNQKSQWTIKMTLWMVLLSIIIALWAWLFPRLPVGANRPPMSPQFVAPSQTPGSIESPEAPAQAPIKSTYSTSNSVADPFFSPEISQFHSTA